MEIKNKSGNVIGKIQIESSEKDTALNEIVMNLQPGEGKAIYVADAAPAHQFTQQTNYAATPWDQGMDILKEKLLPWQPRFTKKHIAQDIQIYYGFNNLSPQEIEEMAQECKSTGSNVVIRDLIPNDNIVGVRVMYDKFLFHLFGTTKTRIQHSYNGQATVTALHVRGYDAFYISDLEYSKLLWIEEDVNGKPLQYEISGQNIEQKDLIELAESLI